MSPMAGISTNRSSHDLRLHQTGTLHPRHHDILRSTSPLNIHHDHSIDLIHSAWVSSAHSTTTRPRKHTTVQFKIRAKGRVQKGPRRAWVYGDGVFRHGTGWDGKRIYPLGTCFCHLRSIRVWGLGSGIWDLALSLSLSRRSFTRLSFSFFFVHLLRAALLLDTYCLLLLALEVAFVKMAVGLFVETSTRL